MSNISLDAQLDLIEQQFNEVSTALQDGNAQAVQSAAARLQQLAVDFTLIVEKMGRGRWATPQRALRIKGLAHTLPALRENLLRRSAYVDRALEMIIPATKKTTYAGGSAYGDAMRQSGAFKFLSA